MGSTDPSRIRCTDRAGEDQRPPSRTRLALVVEFDLTLGCAQTLSGSDGLEWPLPNVSMGMMKRYNVSATGGNGIGYIGDVPNVAIPCSGTIGIMHDPEDAACPFKAMGQFNFAFITPFTTCGTACSMDVRNQSSCACLLLSAASQLHVGGLESRGF